MPKMITFSKNRTHYSRSKSFYCYIIMCAFFYTIDGDLNKEGE